LQQQLNLDPADLMPITTSSRLLRLMLKPSPLAMTGSPNSAVMASAGLAFVPGATAAVVAFKPNAAVKTATNAAAKNNFNLIFMFSLDGFLCDWFNN
jgi:hypothetical protein